MTDAEVRQLLVALDYAYEPEEETPAGELVLDQNDVWAWALAWAEPIPEAALPRIGDLLTRYGYCGLLFWVSERHAQMRSEFEDINRFVDFVRAEETIRAEIPDSNSRAYTKRRYTL